MAKITIKEAFQKLSKVTNAGVKNPWFVIRNLGQTFADVADNIEEGGGGGSTVEVTQVLESGTKIATITVDDTPTDLFAPNAYVPISYSTTEQDTGTTWTDGRHVYQKTYSFENAVSLIKDSYTSTGIDAPGEKLIGVTAYTTTGIFSCGGDINEGKIRLLNPRANDAVPVIGMTIFYVKASS